jgi:putative tRNA adenosine deaminase-associated protein
VSYFTAVLARDGEKWFAHDVDVEDLEDVRELTVALRSVAIDEEPVLLLVEREDAWWAVVRVDADDDPRTFVSDLRGASASPYATVLALDELDASDEDDDIEPGTPSGDFDVLADLGTPAEDLTQMCEDELVPMDALAALAEAGGFDEVLDSLR